MWDEGDKIIYECKVQETGKTCLTGGWVQLDQSGSKSKL